VAITMRNHCGHSATPSTAIKAGRSQRTHARRLSFRLGLLNSGWLRTPPESRAPVPGTRTLPRRHPPSDPKRRQTCAQPTIRYRASGKARLVVSERILEVPFWRTCRSRCDVRVCASANPADPARAPILEAPVKDARKREHQCGRLDTSALQVDPESYLGPTASSVIAVTYGVRPG
jgi:hypothetical protein